LPDSPLSIRRRVLGGEFLEARFYWDELIQWAYG
jgi:hypothetical protein